MNHTMQRFGRPSPLGEAAMTLVEVVVALAISGLAVGSIVSGYLFSANSAEKSALSLAANARAMERIEEARSAIWDTSHSPVVDQLVATNFPVKVVPLDLSVSGVVITYATNVTQISTIPGVSPLKRIHVDCIWSYKGSPLLTNSIETLRGPDQ